MENNNKTNRQLLEKIGKLNEKIPELEKYKTDRRQADEQLAAIYQNAPFIMILVDEERRVKKVNGAAIEFSGSLEEEMLGLRGGEALRCLHHIDDPKGCGFGPSCKECKVRGTVLDTFKTEKSYSHVEESLPFLIDGVEQELTLLISTVLLQHTNGPLVLVTIEDITERKQAEKTIKENEILLRQIINTSPICIFIKDKNGYYLLVNKRMAALHKTTPEALVGTSDLSLAEKWLTTKERIEQFRASEREVIDRNQPLFIPEEEFTYRNGSMRWFQTTKLPIALKNNPDCLMSVAVDITERKQTEDLIKTQRDLGLKLSSVHSLKETLRLCLEAAFDISKMDCGGIYLISDSGSLDLAYHKGLPASFLKSAYYFTIDTLFL